MQFKATLLATAATAMVLSPAFAQDADEPDTVTPAATEEAEEPDDRLVVRGIRDALAESARIKREADNIQDAINAEDISQFPDENVTEALARITGVQISREAGEGNGFTIRGIEQNRVEVNGRTTVGNGESRNASISDIPADLLKTLKVIKSPTADMVEGSLGGTVNLVTRKPFDFRKPRLVLHPSLSYGSESEASDPRFNTLATDSWETPIGKVGVLLNASYSDSNNVQERVTLGGWQGACNFDLDGDGVINSSNGTIWRPVRPFNAGEDGILYTDDDTNNGVGAQYCSIDPDDFVYRPANVVLVEADRQRERFGLVSSLQWQVSDTLSVYLDSNYNEFEDHNEIYTLEMTNGVGDGRSFNWLSNVEADENGIATLVHYGPGAGSMRFTARSQYTTRQSEVFSYALGGKWTPTDNITVTGEIGQSKGEDFTETYQANGNSVNNIGVESIVYIGERSVRVTTPFDLTDVGLFRVGNSNNNIQFNERSENFLVLDVDYDVNLGPISSFEFGTRWTAESFERERVRSITSGVNALAVNVPALEGLYGVRDTSGFMGNVPNTFFPNSYYAISTSAIRNNPEVFDELFGHPDVLPSVPQEEYTFDEWSAAIYAKVNLDTTIAGRPVDGNFGLRAVSNRLATNYTVSGPDGLIPARQSSGEYSYLPSGNIRVGLAEDFYVRAAVAKTMVRPNFGQLRPAPNINYASGQGTIDSVWSGNAGNPQLKPFEATQYDLSFERYFGKRDLLSFAMYYRDIDAFVTSAVEELTFDYIPNEEGTFPSYANLSVPQNGDSAKVYGYEIAGQFTFDHLDDWRRGFGFYGNYTYADSARSGDLSTDVLGRSLPVRGLSKHTTNLAIFYENYGFDGRLAYNWRGQRLTGDSSGDGRQAWNAPVESLDWTSGYRINSTYRVYFNARNLTQRTLYRYLDTEAALLQAATADRRYIMGVVARF